jgi:hypothetical protein
MNYDLVGTWKEEVMVRFNTPSQHLSLGTKEGD